LIFLLVFGVTAIFPESTPSKGITLSERISHLKEFFLDRNLVEASTAEALALATFSCFNAFIVVNAIRIFHFSPQIASLFVSFEGVIFIATLFTLGKVLEKIEEHHFYLSSIAIVVTGLCLLSCIWHPAFLVAGTLFVGVGLGMFNLVNVTRVANADADKGKSAAVFSLFTMLGVILGPIIGGLAGQFFGSWSVFLIFIPIYILLLAILCFRKPLEINCPAS
jgi:predicted MFS family arabinose efflux permease